MAEKAYKFRLYPNKQQEEPDRLLPVPDAFVQLDVDTKFDMLTHWLLEEECEFALEQNERALTLAALLSAFKGKRHAENINGIHVYCPDHAEPAPPAPMRQAPDRAAKKKGVGR